MSELVKCATCKTEKPFSEMQTCMHADREYSVCDMACMIKFYKGEIKPDFVITPDLEEMVKLGMNPKEYDLYKENIELAKQLAKANQRVKELKRGVLEEIENRDNREEWLDKLSGEIARYFGVDIGEHSSANNPWMEAFEAIPEDTLNKFALEQRQEAVEEYKKSDEFCKLLDSHFNSGKVYGHNEYYEQLRKEQEHG